MVDANEENDMEWILEIMTEFLQSPMWKNPIISFVEEKCAVFESTEENRLEYTEIHTQFKRLIESKLEAYIQDLGISHADFVLAWSRAQKRIHQSLLQQIMAVEDFILFKKMMVKRNIAMNKEAIRQMQAKGRQTNRISQAVQQQSSEEEESEEEDEEEDEETMIRRAMEESKRTAEAEEVQRKAIAAAEEAKAQEAIRAQQEAEAARKREEEARAAQARSQDNSAGEQDASGGAFPSLAGAGQLPSLNAQKPKSTGLALFEDIEIGADDASEIVEEKSQRQQLKQEKSAMIAERNRERQQETEAAEAARRAEAQTEDQEAKAARIRRGLQALSLAPTETDKADKRKEIYKNARQALQ